MRDVIRGAVLLIALCDVLLGLCLLAFFVLGAPFWCAGIGLLVVAAGVTTGWYVR